MNRIEWYPRRISRTLHPVRPATKFHGLHPIPNTSELVARNKAEMTIFDIVRNSEPETLERLEIKHITREK